MNRIREFGERARASAAFRRLLGGVEQERHESAERNHRGAKAVIDQRAAARLSAVVGDGEFPEQAVAPEGAVALDGARAVAPAGRATPVTAIAATSLLCLWAGARANHDFGNTVAHAAAAGGSFEAPTAAVGPMFGASRDPGDAGGDPAMTPKNSARVAAMAVAAAVTANGALAGDAVQWRVADGGNGHWYQGVRLSDNEVSWHQAQAFAHAQRAELAQLETRAEFDWVYQTIASDRSLWRWTVGPWLGGRQLPGAIEPAGGWQWLNGSTIESSLWGVDEPFDYAGCGAHEDYLNLFCNAGCEQYPMASPAPTLNDMPESGFCNCCNNRDLQVWVSSAIVEWSADCNADGVVDYGQCRNGTLPDYNVNNVPDCCEHETPCLPGRYPLQWRSEDGGNGHWYQASATLGLTFVDARARATVVGGDLATPQSPAELDFVFRKLASDPAMWWYVNGIPRHGPWIGLRQDRSRPDYSEPAGGWTWIDGTYATFQNWALDTCQTQPTDCFCGGGCGLDNAGFYEGDPASGNTVPTWGAFAADMSGRVGGVIIEWDADCNSDGIVDYGQILAGIIADTDSNGIPDTCECATNPSLPSCCPGDIYRNGRVDGADLGALLSEWGPVTPLTNSDIDGNGQVDGADLGILLAHWGPCGG